MEYISPFVVQQTQHLLQLDERLKDFNVCPSVPLLYWALKWWMRFIRAGGVYVLHGWLNLLVMVVNVSMAWASHRTHLS